MAVLAPFLVLCTFVSGFHHVEATAETLFSWDTDYSRGKLSVTYPELTIKYGDKVPKPLREAITTKWDIPTIRFPAAEEGKKYVLVMVDPDAPRPEKPTAAFWRHWLIVDLKGAGLQNEKLGGKTLTEYYPPSPPVGSGTHRYYFLLFEQPPNTSVSLLKEESSRGKWDLSSFVLRSGLGAPVATQMFCTENFKNSVSGEDTCPHIK